MILHYDRFDLHVTNKIPTMFDKRYTFINLMSMTCMSSFLTDIVSLICSLRGLLTCEVTGFFLYILRLQCMLLYLNETLSCTADTLFKSRTILNFSSILGLVVSGFQHWSYIFKWFIEHFHDKNHALFFN